MQTFHLLLTLGKRKREFCFLKIIWVKYCVFYNDICRFKPRLAPTPRPLCATNKVKSFTNMKLLATLFVTILFFSSCSLKLTHLYETKPLSSTSNKDNTFENDTLKIIYSFWSEGGVFSFSVYNKLSIPLYIDWKKSSFIKNSDKLI